jgi:putative oxidoreductase
MELGLFILRLVIGLLFVGHGSQKLFGAFGGDGIEGTAGFFESVGLRPGRRHARMAGLGETAGGALLALGFLTPVAAAILIAVMVAAVATVHGRKGIWSTDGGYEYNLVLVAAAFALAAVGPGAWSLDSALGIGAAGAAGAVAALALGLVGGLAPVVAARIEQERIAAEQRRRAMRQPRAPRQRPIVGH